MHWQAKARAFTALSAIEMDCWNDLDPVWNIQYPAPADARAMNIPDNSIDCAVSVETLEHIPRADIAVRHFSEHDLFTLGSLIVARPNDPDKDVERTRANG